MTEEYNNYRPFVVDETPYCIWDVDIKERNAEFINSIDPNYFSHIAILHGGLLSGEQRQYAAIALRTEYYHSLETLFALICATVQAPDCVIGWLLKYQNRELFAAVRKIDTRRPIRTRLGLEHFTWDAISARVNKFNSGDKDIDARLHQSFGRLWGHFAKDFLDVDTTNEYNSIKHGLRVSIGGFRLAMGAEITPGVPAAPESMRSLGGSEYGTSFFVAKQLQNRDNFQAMRQSLNWRPENLAHGLSLVSMSIHNIIYYLRLVNGIQQQDIQLKRPENEADFDAPWRLSAGVEFVSMNQEIDENSITIFSRADILSSLESEGS